MEKGEIRRLFLKALSELETGKHSNEDIIDKMIELSEKEVPRKDLLNFDDENQLNNSPLLEAAEYLKDKGFIEYESTPSSSSPGPALFYARIKADGKDVVDDSNRLEKEIPIPQHINQTINVNDRGSVAAITGTGDIDIDIENIMQNAPTVELNELKEFVKNRPNLLEWFKSLVQLIPPLIRIFKHFISN